MKQTGKSTAAYFLIISLALLANACGSGHDHGSSFPVVAPLTVGAPVRDTVGQGGINYYYASVTTGTLYKISITDLNDDSDLLVFGADSSFTSLAACSIDTTRVPGATTPEDCVIAAPGDTLYFAVDGSFLSTAAGSFTIDVERPAVSNITVSVPLADSRSLTGLGVYAASVLPGTAYTIAVTGMIGDVDLHIFGADGTFGSPAACSIRNTQFIGTGPEDCTITASGSSLYFIVDGLFGSSPAVSYTTFVTPAPVVAAPVSEGSLSAPVSVVADSPVIGRVGTAGDSFYATRGLTAGARYTVTVSGMSSNVNLTVFGSDGTFAAPASCLIDRTFLSGTTPESCTLDAPAGTLFFSVSAGPNASSYVILVSPGP